MSGKISEESNEDFNGTLNNVKSLLQCMPSTTDRINITTARTQVNLKGNVLDEKLVITKAITGKKRGRQQAKTRLMDIRSVIGEEDGFILFKEEKFFIAQWKPSAGGVDGHL